MNYILSPILPDKIKIHPSGILKVVLAKSKAKFYLKTNQTSFLTREIFWKKPEGFEYTKIFVDLIQKVQSFVDIGANIGYYSIVGAKVNPNLKVYSFEPSEGVLKYLNENIKINQLEKQVTSVSVALSDSKGSIDFYELKNPKFPNIHNLSGEHNTGAKKDRLSNKIKVETTTLDDFVLSQKINSLEFMKLDTEGAENIILKGAKKTIEKFRPLIVCETLFNTIEADLEDTISGFDYHFYNETPHGLQRVNTIQRSEDNGVRNCFFVPPEKIHLIEEWIVK